MKVWHVVRREQRPITIFKYALHEEVGHPVCGVHIVGSATIVSRIFAELQELLDIHVPCFEIGADRPFTLTTLVHGNSGIVDHLEERNNALTLSVGALDIGAKRTNRCPVISEPACKLR